MLLSIKLLYLFSNLKLMMLLNKYVSGSTPVTVSVAGRTAGGAGDAAQVWQLAGGATTRLANAAVTNNATTLTLPAQSVTLLVLPKTTTPTPVPRADRGPLGAPRPLPGMELEGLNIDRNPPPWGVGF